MKNSSKYDGLISRIDTHFDRIEYNMARRILTIYYSNYTTQFRGKVELLYFMESYKILHAPELGKHKFVYNDRVFQFSDLHEEVLAMMGKVTLGYLGKLVEFASSKKDSAFLHKYYKFKFHNV